MQLPPLASLHAAVSHDTHVPHGAFGHAPPMLRPGEIDGGLTSARQRAAQSRLHPHSAAPPTSRSVSPVGPRAGAAPGRSRGRGTRTIQFTAGTGINPWWRYQEYNVPGGGHLMVNVGTGDLLLQDDDMSVPHKGITLAFRRTYNSQSQHDVNGTDGAVPSMYGNGWTNTFDAHLSASGPGEITVWDIDGAHYDYNQAPDGTWTPPIGEHATLVSDGGAGMLWTKKSGTTYYFWLPANSAVSGSSWEATFGAYEGRLYEIIGRNRNTYLVFGYGFDTPTGSAPGGKVSAISANTESGMTAMLTFIDVSGHRLLDHITYPDGTTSVSYSYDTLGNLTSASRPPNNSAGTRPVQTFGYYASGGLLNWAASPRWNGSDGGLLAIGYDGTTAPTATVNSVAHYGVVNPVVPDGTGAALQSGYPSSAVTYLQDWYGTGGSTPWFHDSDGHSINWVMDSQRPIQTQVCTAMAGWNCTGTWLVSNESWDANNNLTTTTDARGFQTDYAYDATGNTIAVAQPQVTTSQGTFRPTSLISYDAFSNVTAYCEPDASHALSSDWTNPPSGDGLCPTTSLLAARFIWSTDPTQSGNASPNPSYEPYGQLIAKIAPGTPAAPGGYRINYTYDSSRQGGADYGLPTTVAAAAPISQADGTQRQPTQSFWYDGNGWLGCYNSGSGTWVLGYDALGRLIITADPDDSANNGICSKASGMSSWSTASTTAYFPDGSISSKQSASQRAAGVSTAFTYDADGNENSETHHFGCVAVSSCNPGVTYKWYDGADRLVEVALPYDANDVQGYRMMTRYTYDLSQGGTTPYQGVGLRGYGNLVKTQELLSGTVITPFTFATSSSFVPYPFSTGAWTDVRAASFDGLDRPLSLYEAAFASQPKVTNTYDGASSAGGSAQLGLLSSVTLATNEVKQYNYDALDNLTDITYSNDNGTTSPVHVRYDASGRVVSRGTDALGNEVLQYDAAGELTSLTYPASLGSATVAYHYYDDGARKDLSFASTVYTASPLYQYSYRADSRRSSLKLNNGSAFTWSYTPAGRLQIQTDPQTGKTIAPDNGYTTGSERSHPYYPSSLTYVPKSYAFDNYGRTVSVTLPEGVFSQSVTGFDLDDGLTGVSSLSVQAPTNVTTTACANSNVRNEKLPMYRGTCAGLFLNGATFALQEGAATGTTSAIGITPWTVDARAGMLMSWQGPMQSDGNASSGQFSYDASGRLTGDAEQLDRVWRAGDPSMPGNRVYSTGTRTKTYDAENRLRSQQTSPATGASFPNWGKNNPGGYWNDVGQGSAYELQAVDYSADSHPVRFAGTQTADGGISPTPLTLIWLWDGNDVLAQCGYMNSSATQCTSYGFSVEGLANYNPSNGYVAVQDRGLLGQVVAKHDALSFSGMTPVGRNSRNYFVGIVGSTAPNSGGPDTISGPPGPFGMATGTKIALDGWTLDNNTWQGVRTYDASIGQWNTPDAYAGDVDDPMSQQPFMWNRNNPYEYSDPSGFSPCPLASPSGGLKPIGCVKAKPVPPGRQLMPDGSTVAETVARTKRSRDVLGESMAWVPLGPEGAGAEWAGRRWLARNLARAGIKGAPGQVAHHIVAFGAKRARPAREILKKFGVDINDVANGMWIDKVGGHSNLYFDTVNARLAEATSEDEVRGLLQQIANDIRSGDLKP
jgi:YD repeat-containing protein